MWDNIFTDVHLYSVIFRIHSNLGYMNSRVTKPSYKNELRIMTSQAESLIFRVRNSMSKKLSPKIKKN